MGDDGSTVLIERDLLASTCVRASSVRAAHGEITEGRTYRRAEESEEGHQEHTELRAVGCETRGQKPGDLSG